MKYLLIQENPLTQQPMLVPHLL